MTKKQEIFIREYVKDFNGTRAYKVAYGDKLSDKAAGANASRLLGIDSIQEEMYKYSQEQLDKIDVDVNYIVSNIKEVAERCMQKKAVMYFDKEDKEYKQEKVLSVDEETGEVKGEGIWEFDAGNALKGLELLGKYKGIFKEKVEHSGDVSISYEQALEKVKGNEY